MKRSPFRSFLRPRRTVAIAGIAAAVGIASALVATTTGGSSSRARPMATTIASRGSVTVGVIGSGPISASAVAVQNGAPSSASTAAKPSSATVAPTGYPVYPSVTGQVVSTLVVPGQVVRVGQPLVVLADSSAAGAVLQAQIGLRTAQIATSAAAPNEAVLTQARLDLANARLAYETLRKAPVSQTRAALAAARLAIRVAQLKLHALVASPSTPSPSQIAAAQLNITLAQQQLAALGNPTAVDKTAALLAVQKAQADLDALLSAPLASSESAAIAQARLDLASAKVAYSSLRLSSAPPTRGAIAATRLAITVADQKLAALLSPPTQASTSLNRLQVMAAESVLNLAHLRQEALTVRAPVRGTVTGVFVAPGMQADPTVAVAAVADLSHLFVTIEMSEFDVAHIRPGDRALVDVAALGGTALPATVVAVAPVGVSNSGVVQFPVMVALRKAPTALRPGMLASVQVITAERNGVIRVPLDAISMVSGGSNDGQMFVTISKKGGRKEVRFVKIGLAGANYAEVLQGLKGGERLLIPTSTVAASNGGAPANNAPPGIGVPPAGQGNQSGQ